MTVPEAAAGQRRSSVFAAMSVPHYRRLWASGILWNLTRWMSIFVCSYLVNDLTGSPFLVQMVGSAFFAPMFFGGVLGGLISDRFDRRHTIMTQLLLLIPIVLLMCALVTSDLIRVWMVYPYMLVIGLGGVIDMTSRRALVFDFVGEARVTNALALESLSAMSGNLLGAVLGGTFIALVGMGPAFGAIAVCFVIAYVLLSGVPTPKRVIEARPAGSSVVRDLGNAFRYVRGHRGLLSILGVTVVMNLFYFSFMPMVPVFAEKLDVGAFWAGLLASGTSAGSIMGNLLIARGAPIGRGLTYVGGAILAMVSLFLFAASPWYALALLALVCAGVGNAGFATMQSVLVLVSADPTMRGRSMGILSMAIGALPFSMLVLGGVAQVVGPSAAVMGSVTLGVAAMLAFTRWRPESHRLP